MSDFIGVSNILEGKVVTRTARELVIELGSGARVRAAPVDGPSAGDRVEVAIRPEKVEITDERGRAENRLPGSVENVVYLGAVTYYHVQTPDGWLVVMEQNRASRHGDAPSPVGRAVHVCWDVEHTLVLASAS